MIEFRVFILYKSLTYLLKYQALTRTSSLRKCTYDTTILIHEYYLLLLRFRISLNSCILFTSCHLHYCIFTFMLFTFMLFTFMLFIFMLFTFKIFNSFMF